MVACSRGRGFVVLLLLVTFFLALFPEEAEARRRGRRFRRGGAARVSMRRGPQRRGRQVAQRNAGRGRGQAVARRNQIGDIAIDANGNAVFNGSFGVGFDDRFDDRFGGNRLQRVVINGQVLDLAQDGRGRVFAVRNGLASSQVVDPADLVSQDPLIQLRGGQIIRGFDSRGRALGSNVDQSIAIFNSGGIISDSGF